MSEHMPIPGTAGTTPDKIDIHNRQQLSALVDGALSPDEARFMLRRLEHDEALAGCHERWQLLGDVLRGQACAPAPVDFAARVRSAVAAEPAPPPPGNPPWHLHTQAASDGSVVVQVAEPGALQLGALLPVLWLVLKSQLGVFLWHGLVVWVTVRSGLAPLQQLAQRISRRRAGDLAPVQVDRLYAETAPVVHELNALLAHEAQRLEADHEQLVVQKRAQATPGRVQQIATGQLQMRPANPAITEYVKGAPVALPAQPAAEARE